MKTEELNKIKDILIHKQKYLEKELKYALSFKPGESVFVDDMTQLNPMCDIEKTFREYRLIDEDIDFVENLSPCTIDQSSINVDWVSHSIKIG